MSERWRDISAIYNAALLRVAADRDAYIVEACGGDDDLRREVESLLGQGESFLATPAAHPPGSRIGAYELNGVLGAGGMGIVYRARDVKLQRDVALKVLPQAVALDPERVARFRREATVLASLNHPNIGGIYGFEDSGDVHALVLELVNGPTLADRIAQGPIPVDEALPIAKQIAEALEAAHEQGIIHRDLKPANIKLRPDGTVKVLDFGLAKALEPSASPRAGTASLAPTITSPAVISGVGVLLGTAAYMSPEQAKGHPADKRGDVWAFGCVLYEMLTGKRAFEGDDVTDTLAAVLRSEPDWAALPPSLPPAITDVIKAALIKDRRRRIADVAVASFAFDRLAAISSPLPRGFSPRHRLAWTVVTVIAALAFGTFGWWMGMRNAPSERAATARFTILLPEGQRFSNTGRNVLALSPDGRYLVYVANFRLNIRSLDRIDPKPIPGTESSGGANSPGATRSPFFSPDGQWIGYWQDGQIRKVGVNGGAPVPICAVTNPFGISWTKDGTILYAEGGTIWRVPDSGGQPQPIVKIASGLVQSPEALPDTDAIIFTLYSFGAATQPQIIIRSVTTGTQRMIIRAGADARYVASGHLVYFAGSTLLAVPFDIRTLSVTGVPTVIAEHVASGGVPGRSPDRGIGQFVISKNGTLAYITGTFVESRARTLVWADRSGREQSLGLEPRPYVYPRLAPDGTRVGLTVPDEEQDVWIWDIQRKTLTRFTFDPADDRYSSWTPDGRRIAFSSSRGGEAGLWWQAADGTGTPERLAAFPLNQYLYFLPTTWSPDAMHVVGTATPGGGGFEGAAPGVIGPATPDIWMLTMTGQRRFTPLLQTAYAERNPEISPDGRWIAYESLESGRPEVYVRPFPDISNGKWQVSTAGGSQPLWSRDAAELFFVSGSNELMTAQVKGHAPFVTATPKKVIDGKYVWSVPAYAGRMYDVSADGRFLMMKELAEPGQTSTPASVIVVEHWFEELKRLVPAPE